MRRPADSLESVNLNGREGEGKSTVRLVFTMKCLKMGGGLTWLIIVSSCVLWVSVTVSKTISLRPVFECPLCVLHAVPIAHCISLWVCRVWGSVRSQIIELSIVHSSPSFLHVLPVRSICSPSTLLSYTLYFAFTAESKFLNHMHIQIMFVFWVFVACGEIYWTFRRNVLPASSVSSSETPEKGTLITRLKLDKKPS